MAYGSSTAKVTAPGLRAMRERGERIVCLTAYDEPGARFAEESGVDVVLVGDSLANVVFGYPDTLHVGMPEIVHHLRAVRRGVSRAHLVTDLPFGSYQISVEDALRNAVELMRHGADAVKLEGDYPETIRAFGRAGIPTMGHVGLTPQSIHAFGGFKIQGKSDDAATALLQMAERLEDAGAYAIVLELIPPDVAERITEALSIPTIGIGAGDATSGQIQVMHDVLGYSESPLRHARPFGEAHKWMRESIAGYVRSVKG